MGEGPSTLRSERSYTACHAAPWLALALAFFGAPAVSAQEPAASTTATATTANAASAAPSASNPEPEGAELYRQAESRYVSGDVAGALVLMEKSYSASARPELLFNIGQLHRELHHCREARESYERYLALAKTGTHRDEAERSRLELAPQCPATEAATTGAGASPLATEPEQVKPYWTPVRIAAWSTIGGSVVLAGTASYFALHAHHLQNEFDSDVHDAKLTGGAYVTAYQDLESDGQHAAVVARGLAVTALGVAAIGVSLLVFNPGGRQANVNAVSLRCNADGATAVYRGTF